MTSGVYIRTEKMKENMSKAKTGKNNPNYGKRWTKLEKANEKIEDKKYPFRKGNDIGISQIHRRAHKVDPKPIDNICQLCGKVADKDGKTKLIHSNKDHSYKLPINPNEWQWIHESCHRKFD